jgi:CshA-type fibril repeat protein
MTRKAATPAQIKAALAKLSKTESSPLALRALEPRIVFDGAGAVIAAAIIEEATASTAAPAMVDPGSPDVGHAADSSHSALVDAISVLAAQHSAATAGTTVVFIDAAVQDPTAIAAAVPAGAEVVTLVAGSDGVSQIAAYLQGRSGVGAIHILSHGESGELRLGNTTLDSASIGKHAADLATISAALTDSADILIYGCDVAAGVKGQSFVSALAVATGADIAASTDDTGAAALGGNWTLETKSGLVEAKVIDAPDWSRLLAPLSISTTSQPTVTGATAIDPLTGLQSGGVGYSAIWTNAGSIGSTSIDVRATVLSLSASTVSYFTQGDDLSIILNGGATATIKWEIFASGTSQTISAVGSPHFQIADIDGIGGQPNTRETVKPQLTGLTGYTVDSPTNLVATTSSSGVQVSGTQNQNGEQTSLTAFDWQDVSTWSVEYTLSPASGYANAIFRHDGDGDFTFASANTVSLLALDLDGNNSSALGAAYRGTFVENGNAVPIIDNDALISQHSVLGTNLGQAHITLTNAQAGDSLSYGALPSGITATIDTSVSGQITITLNGSDTIANYQAALAAIRFSNSTDTPSAIDRIIAIDVRNTLYSTTSAEAISTIRVTPINDAPVALGDVKTAIEDTVTTGNVITDAPGADHDIDSASLSVTQFTIDTNGDGTPEVFTAGQTASIPGVGTLTISSTGAYAFAPALNYSGPVPVATYTLSDGSLTDTATLALTITPVNDAPVAVNDNLVSPLSYGPTLNVGGSFESLPGAPNPGYPLPAYSFAIGGWSATNTDGEVLTAEPGRPAFEGNQYISLLQNAGQNPGTAWNETSATYGGYDRAVTILNVIPGQTYTINFAHAGDNRYGYTGDTTLVQIQSMNTAQQQSNAFATPGLFNWQQQTVTFTADAGTTQIALLFSAMGAGNSSAVIDAITVRQAIPGVTGPYVTPEDTALTTVPMTNDSDPDGDLVHITHVDGQPITAGGPAVPTTHGAVSLSANGLSFVFTPSPDYFGPADFTYAIADPSGLASTATVYVEVTPVNDAPVAVGDTKAVIEDTATTGNVITDAPGADHDGDTASLSVTQFTVDTNGDGTREVFTAGQTATIPGVGTLTVGSTGAYTFTPALNYNGPVPVATYTLGDGTLTDIATLALTITPVNDAPVANNDFGTVIEDTIATGTVIPNDTDVDGGALSVAQFSVAGIGGTFIPGQTANIPNVGTLQINPNGTYTFTPIANFAGTVPVASYAISDGNGGVATANLSLTMTPVNDPPVATSDSGIGLEDATVVINVLANDGDIDNTLDPASIVITTTPPGATLSADSKTLTVPGQGVWTVDPTTGTITFTPAANYNGTPTPISYRTADAGGLFTNSVSVSVTITPVNDAPIVDLNSAATSADSVRGNATTFTEGDAPVNVAPIADVSDSKENDIASLKIAVAGIKDGAFEIVSIGGTNFNPTLASNAVVTIGGTDFLVTYTAGGGGAGIFFIQQVGGGAIPQPDLAALVQSVSYQNTDEAPIAGNRTLTFTVKDLSNTSGVSAVATIVVVPVNDLPVDANETNAANEEVTLTVTNNATGDLLLNATDADGDPLTITSYKVAGVAGTPVIGTAFTIAGKGDITINANGSYAFVPVANFNAAVPQITYTISDGNGGTDTSTLDLTITSVNDAPAGIDGSASINDNQTKSFSSTDFGITDPDDSPANTLASVVITSLPTSGTLTLGDTAVAAGDVIPAGSLSSLVFTPSAGVGTPSFTFQVRDNGGTANGGIDTDPSAKTFTLTVTDTTAPLAPVATSAPNPGGTLTTTGTGEPGATITVTFPDGSTGTTTVAPDGTFSVTSATPQTSGNVVTKQSDPAGNTSPPDADAYVDTTAPLAPVATSAPNPDGTLTTTGTGEPGATITVTFPDGSTGTTTVAPDGTFSVTSATPQTSGNVVTKQTDPAGNTSPQMSEFVIDRVAVILPETAMYPTSGSGVAQQPDTESNPIGVRNLGSLSENSGIWRGTQTTNKLGVRNHIINAANGIDNLNGLRGLSDGQGLNLGGVILEESARINRLWNAEAGEFSATIRSGWDVKPLSGLSARFVMDGIADSMHAPRFTMESIVRDGVLIATLSSTRHSHDADVVDYRITQQGGRALPQWLERRGIDLLQGRPPVGVETITLDVTAILSDGTQKTHKARIHTATGSIDIVADKRATLQPLRFAEQMYSTAQPSEAAVRSLADALAE